MSTTHLDAIVIRHATAADARAVAELAILDSREPLSGPVLIAEVDGVARAAHGTRIVRDSFVGRVAKSLRPAAVRA